MQGGRGGAGEESCNCTLTFKPQFRPSFQREHPQSWLDRVSGTWDKNSRGSCGQESPSPLNTDQGQALHQLPILFKIIQASRKIL